MAIAPGYTALICPACTENQLWLGEEGLECRRCGTCRAEPGRRPCPAPCRGRGAAGARHAADVNGGIAKAFFPTEAARAGHYRDLDVILGQLMGRKSFGEVLELGASGGAWTWGLAHDDRVRRLYATETSPAALAHLAEITADGAALILESPSEGLAIEMASLDLVVGRGALSRETDPTPLLTNVKRWLKPGGVAVFLEPCLQGKIWTAFVMDLIRRFEAQGGPGPATGRGRRLPRPEIREEGHEPACHDAPRRRRAAGHARRAGRGHRRRPRLRHGRPDEPRLRDRLFRVLPDRPAADRRDAAPANAQRARRASGPGEIGARPLHPDLRGAGRNLRRAARDRPRGARTSISCSAPEYRAHGP
jgi:SAM-dependent methyltransferase